MIKKSFYTLHGIFSILMLAINTLFWFTPVILMGILKLIIPLQGFRAFCNMILDGIAEIWIAINNFNIQLTKGIRWELSGMENLSGESWYLVLSNHQSWVDIIVLQKAFNHKIPFLKFFLKKELIWVPLLGLAWWALDFPFMKRYTSDFVRKNPHLKGKDLEITRKACEKYRSHPVSIMNFVEGTRFTAEKHTKQQSPFSNLLRPKAGGVGYVLSAMGDQLTHILNVTIVYPDGDTGFWNFVCGRIKRVIVSVETIPVTQDLLGDYEEDQEYRKRFQVWLNDIWQKKNERIRSILSYSS